MAGSLLLDAAITWIGAAGCTWHLYVLRQSGRGRGVAATRFLVGVLATLLSVRGFAWLADSAMLDRVTLCAAGLLPIAITIFVEHVLRRHHPLWLKITALGSTTGLVAMTLATWPARSAVLVTVFAATITGVVVANAVLLSRYRSAGLGKGEERIAGALMLVGLLAGPLVLTDFRVYAILGDVRLGAIAALLFSYSMLGSVTHASGALEWTRRFVLLLLAALAISGSLALSREGLHLGPWWSASLAGWPLAYALILLAAIYVTGRTIRNTSTEAAFLRWLSTVPLGSRAGFLRELGRSPDAANHAVLGPDDLVGYDVYKMNRTCNDREPVASLDRMRTRLTDDDPDVRDGTEQWVDLLEGLQMTHGFVVAEDPPIVVAVGLPATTPTAAAENRLAVMRHLSRSVPGE